MERMRTHLKKSVVMVSTAAFVGRMVCTSHESFTNNFSINTASAWFLAGALLGQALKKFTTKKSSTGKKCFKKITNAWSDFKSLLYINYY